jgi:hypothetical protein
MIRLKPVALQPETLASTPGLVWLAAMSLRGCDGDT